MDAKVDNHRPMTSKEVGLVIRSYREAMGWSQETLAELSGLTARTRSSGSRRGNVLVSTRDERLPEASTFRI